MNRKRLLALLRESLQVLAQKNSAFPVPPEDLNENHLLESLGITRSTAASLVEELSIRLGVVPDIPFMLFLDEQQGKTRAWNPFNKVDNLLYFLQAEISHRIQNPMAVYVDDEEENLFIFKRKFNNRMSLRTFGDPREAIDFILKSPNVVLVITDEVMPHLTGNQLRDVVHKQKPFLKFILITGNPQHDDDLMYRSLKRNRFYDCIQKPIDLENKGEEYFSLFSEVLSGDYY